MKSIDTAKFSASLRQRAILRDEHKILIARLAGSGQETDLTEPVNCNGYGRIRHFRIQQFEDWSPNPLPILPAAQALAEPHTPVLRAQVFQNAACNWRCWYCFVDDNRLSADQRVADYFTAAELISLFLAERDRPRVLDLSGGQPDLVPEWILWTMRALDDAGLTGSIFLWSDDNLSTRYHWQFLSDSDRRYMRSFPKYARVGCFKGFDETSFAFNTRASQTLFAQQFAIFRDLLHEGYDMYAYATFTSPPVRDICTALSTFVDRLQDIHPLLPLRTVPLKVLPFSQTQTRLTPAHNEALALQHEAHREWLVQLRLRFSESQRAQPLTAITLHR